MSIKSKFKTFFFLDDEHDDHDEEFEEELEPIVKQQKQPVKSQNVVSLAKCAKSIKGHFN